jgi:MFS family permease
VYISLRSAPATATSQIAPVRHRVATTVIVLGIVSMVTDISTESVNAVLPNYLIIIVGLSPQAFGVVNGLYNGVSAVVRLLGGWTADRFDHPKSVAFIGYGASAVSKLFLLSAHSFGAFSAIATADQLGKGLRTAPRDSMIAASTPRDALGRAFGVHRSLDTLGALLGPLMAFVILDVVPNDFHSVFVASAAFAFMGLAALLLIVPDIRPGRTGQSVAPGQPPVPRRSAGRTRVPLRQLMTPQMAQLLAAAAMLGLLSIGETYVFLELQDRDGLALKYFPLLVVGMNLAYLALAIPLGRLADRVGRWRVFVGGYAALLLAYLGSGGPVAGPVTTCSCLVLLGAFYAATDGVLAAMAGRMSPPRVRSSAIAAAQTTLALATAFSALGFAVLWSAIGRTDALLIAAAGLAIVLPGAALLLRGADRSRREAFEPETRAA